MKNLNNKHFLLLGAWFVINMLQSIFTGLHSDESYYWMYSQNLDWGYFDHPPMAALFIFLGSSVFSGEVGVRIFLVLVSTLTMALILNELNEKRDIWILTIFVLSFPLIHTHIAGFLAIPDVPLLFFTMVFLFFYKLFMEKPGWGISVLLGITIAALIYSKYHAFLIIGFTLFSNLKLLKSKYFYAIVTVTAVLLIPHLLWQIENQFPTFKYHLVERAKPFQFKYQLPYILGVLAVAGPFTGVIVYWKLLKLKIENGFQKALIFNIVGFVVLFFVMSFKNRIEIHWLAAIIPMLMILTYPTISSDEKIRKWFVGLAIPVITLLFLFRIYIAIDAIPNVGSLKITFYNRENSAIEIKKMANGKKVGFYNNYAAISNYIFYTGDPAVHLSTPDYRFCQYDLWGDEQFARQEPLFAIQSKHLNPPNQKKMITGETKGYLVIEKFQPLNGLNIEIGEIEKNGNKFDFSVFLINLNPYRIETTHISMPVLAVMANKKEIADFPLSSSTASESIGATQRAVLRFSISEDLVSAESRIQIYTRSKENIRGEVISIKIADVLK